MLLVAQVREGKRTIPAVTHVDNSARIQTVTREASPLYYDLIAEFETLNRRAHRHQHVASTCAASPSSARPHDAYLCFMRTNMDDLVLGPYFLDKKEQPEFSEDVDWRTLFEPD